MVNLKKLRRLIWKNWPLISPSMDWERELQPIRKPSLEAKTPAWWQSSQKRWFIGMAGNHLKRQTSVSTCGEGSPSSPSSASERGSGHGGHLQYPPRPQTKTIRRWSLAISANTPSTLRSAEKVLRVTEQMRLSPAGSKTGYRPRLGHWYWLEHWFPKRPSYPMVASWKNTTYYDEAGWRAHVRYWIENGLNRVGAPTWFSL